MHTTGIELVDAIPAALPVASEVSLTVKVAAEPPVDLRDAEIEVWNRETLVATAPLAEFEDGANRTSAIALSAPEVVGPHVWTVVFPRHEAEGAIYEESRCDFSFETKPHATSLAVWDVTSPVLPGQTLAIKVGAKCSAGCNLSGKEVELRDAAGDCLARGTFGPVPRQGTEALYWTELRLTAPANAGVAALTAAFAAAELELAHGSASTRFSFAVVRPPEHKLTVKVLDKETAAPVASADIRVGAYRARTDESGLAEVGLPKGEHKLSVWKTGYKSPARPIAVEGDTSVEIEVVAIPEENPYERYV